MICIFINHENNIFIIQNCNNLVCFRVSMIKSIVITTMLINNTNNLEYKLCYLDFINHEYNQLIN